MKGLLKSQIIDPKCTITIDTAPVDQEDWGFVKYLRHFDVKAMVFQFINVGRKRVGRSVTHGITHTINTFISFRLAGRPGKSNQ